MVLSQTTQLISFIIALLLYLQLFLFQDDEAAFKVHQRLSQAIRNIPAIDVRASIYAITYTQAQPIKRKWLKMNERNLTTKLRMQK